MNCRFSNICTNAASVWWPSETDDSNVSGETEATKRQLLWWRQFHLIVMVLICKCPLLAVKIGFAFISLFVCFLHFCLRLIQMPCDRKCEQQKTESSLLSTLTQQHTVQQAQCKANNATQWIIIFHYWKKKKKTRILLSTRVSSLRDAKFICFYEGVCARTWDTNDYTDTITKLEHNAFDFLLSLFYLFFGAFVISKISFQFSNDGDGTHITHF